MLLKGMWECVYWSTDIQGHGPVPGGWHPSIASALLEFAEALTHILRISYSVDLVILPLSNLTLDTAALRLSSCNAKMLALQLLSPSASHSQQPVLITNHPVQFGPCYIPLWF